MLVDERKVLNVLGTIPAFTWQFLDFIENEQNAIIGQIIERGCRWIRSGSHGARLLGGHAEVGGADEIVREGWCVEGESLENERLIGRSSK